MELAVRSALRLLREPVPAEKKRLLRERWEALDPHWRSPGQGWGQEETGYGATIGVHPRCDLACTGCYLGAEANHVRPVATEEAFRQLDRLRSWLGPKGNVQITDGEVTCYARRIGLIPMAMSRLRDHLVVEGGLTEVPIHIDTTQRGRLGYRDARDETELSPLREEFAGMIRDVRRRSRRPLRAAMTQTITRDNLDGVAGVVEWCLREPGRPRHDLCVVS